MGAEEPGRRQLLIDRLASVQFSETRIRPGYVKADVDQFLATLRDSLAGRRNPPLTATDIRSVRFSTIRLKAGYDEQEVDDLLDEMERELA